MDWRPALGTSGTIKTGSGSFFSNSGLVIQSKMKDSSSKIFPLIVYADKSKISSFGTQKGYPVVARCGLLPVAICNGTGLGGGAVVGWLPVVCSSLFILVLFDCFTLNRYQKLRKIMGSRYLPTLNAQCGTNRWV